MGGFRQIMARKRRPSAPKHQRQESLFTKAGAPRKRLPRTFARGKRPGRPALPNARLRHAKRPTLAKRYLVHVTWRMRADLPNLRDPTTMGAIRNAYRRGKNRFGFRLVHYSVQSNHVHMLCEAQDERSLARGLQGLAVRVAKAINRTLSRKGKVLDDRYHSLILTTPRQVRWALGYVLNNARRHNAEFAHAETLPAPLARCLLVGATLRRLALRPRARRPQAAH